MQMSKLYNRNVTWFQKYQFLDTFKWEQDRSSSCQILGGCSQKTKQNKTKKTIKNGGQGHSDCDVQCPVNSITHHFSKYISQWLMLT